MTRRLASLVACLLAILMVGLAGLSCSGPVAQKSYRIGVLAWRANVPAVDGFKKGLGALGISEGSNLEIVYRDAAGDPDKLQQFAAELVSERPDLIFGTMAQGGRAAVKAARDSGTPVVYYTGVDPVTDGLAESLTRPAATATGVWTVVPVAKQLEFLSKAAPGAKKVLLFHDEGAFRSVSSTAAREAAQILGMSLVETVVKDKDGVMARLATLVPGEVDALYNFPSGFEATNASAEGQAALRLRLPMSTGLLSDAGLPGVLLSYSYDPSDVGEQCARLAAKILRGVSAGEIPIEAPSRYRLVINMATARAIGLAVPPDLLSLADRVIDE